MAPHLIDTSKKIGVMAPSSYVEKKDIELSQQRLEALGYSVFIHPQTYEKENQSAGTVMQKALALQGLWQRKDIDAIWYAGGGNHAMELLNALNFEKIKAMPLKPTLGFSDCTILINALTHHCGGIHYHAPVFSKLHKMNEEDLQSCLSIMSGDKNSIHFDQNDVIRDGIAEGILIGGNLSLFQYLPALLGTDFTQDKILILEDCHEELSRIDRMFCFLKTSGIFKSIKGLVLGDFSDLQDSGRAFRENLEDIIYKHTLDADFPIVKNLKFGHKVFSDIMPLGQKIKLETQSSILNIA